MFIDNIGRYVIKNYHVKPTPYKSSWVFTTGIHIVLDKKVNFQVWKLFTINIYSQKPFSKTSLQII